MKNKRLLSLLLVFLLIFSFSACEKSKVDTVSEISSQSSVISESSEKNESTPLLYKVSDDKGNCVWLFGSIHVGDDYFYPLPEYVISAYEEADSLAVEFDITAYEKDYKAQMQSLKAFVYTDGTKITDHISEKTYEKAKAILKENNMYNSAMDYYFPAFWSSLIDNILYEKIDANYDLGIDRHMIDRAYKQKKKIHDIESAELQYSMMASFSTELQEMMLESSVTSYKIKFLTKHQLKNMMKAWANGSEKNLVEQLNSEGSVFMSKEQKELYAEYTEKILYNRNITMTDWAESALNSGEKVFICVGAAHIVGDDAMADLLEKRGYKVEIIK